jgi:23S rRNA (guanosine2251-2'-O)-methyltransferase
MFRIVRINPLMELMLSSPQRISRLTVQKDSDNRRVQEIVELARKHRIVVTYAPRKTLDRMDRHHQGVAAWVVPKGTSSVNQILADAQVPFLILLDGVEDPQNLGAIVRTAEGAGVDGIILPERRAAGVTETVFSVSAGALEHMPVAQVKNLARTMGELRKKDIWLVGAEGGSDLTCYDFDYTGPVAIVLGSEGKGLRPLIKAKCDAVLSIPLLGKISSLNVSAAAAVFMYEVVRQRKQAHQS